MIYELHVGTFTREGTWAAAAARTAPNWRELGVTRDRADAGRRVRRPTSAGATTASICSRRRASTARPDDFRALRRRARTRVGIGVILDVVYNHLGPDGNYLRAVLADVFHRPVQNEWGDAINFDGAAARAGARVLRRERRLLDRRIPHRRPAARRDAADLRRVAATHPDRAIGRARAREARRRAPIFIVAENEPQDTRLVRPAADGRLRARRAVERRLPPHARWWR